MSPDSSREENLRCIGCGYNLRGLAGDPLRCPECGHQNNVAALMTPASTIKKEITRMETVATWTVACLWICICGLAFAGWADSALGALVSVAGLLGWMVGVGVFGRSVGHRPGWIGILCLFHLVGSLMLSGFVAVGLLACCSYDYLSDTARFLIMTFCFVGFTLAHLLKAFLKLPSYKVLNASSWTSLNRFAREGIKGDAPDV